ncbi:MAG: DUF3865 domain-containing protein [Pyrinomonadaceae bacterium]
MNTKAKIMRKINLIDYSAMLEKSESLNFDKNPFIKNLSTLKAKELEVFLGQYCHFPRNIISILVSACYTMGYHQWNEVVNELRDNIYEELGKGYGTISDSLPPHYSMLRSAIKDGLSLEINTIEMRQTTKSFLNSLNKYMDKSPSYAAGAVYALEATAIPELSIVYHLTKHLFRIKNLDMPKLLIDFFEFHIDEIEVQHRDRFLDTMSGYIKDEESIREFNTGFRFTINTMDKWWSELYAEVHN